MTPKEKAIDLITKFMALYLWLPYYEAVEPAKLCVKEIQLTLSENVFTEIEFWNEVLKELDRISNE